jgi:hypothetical protein
LGALLLGFASVVSLPSLAWSDITRSPLFSWSKPIQATDRFPPFRLKSYPALKKLVEELESPEYANKRIFVLASSFEFNPSILRSLSPELAPRILDGGDVDLRDGFSVAKALNADFIVTTRKPALHLPMQHQQVIVIPNRALLDSASPLGKSFTANPEKTYDLSDGNKVYILRRVSSLSPEDISWLTAKFRESYPSWRLKDGVIGPVQP